MIFTFSDISLKQCTWQLQSKEDSGQDSTQAWHFLSHYFTTPMIQEAQILASVFTPSVFQEHIILCITIGQRPRKASKQQKTFGRPSTLKLLHIRSVVCPKSQTKQTVTKKTCTHLHKCGAKPEHFSWHVRHGCPSSTSSTKTPWKWDNVRQNFQYRKGSI